jgi:hypothetical protein
VAVLRIACVNQSLGTALTNLLHHLLAWASGLPYFTAPHLLLGVKRLAHAFLR